MTFFVHAKLANTPDRSHSGREITQSSQSEYNFPLTLSSLRSRWISGLCFLCVKMNLEISSFLKINQ
jgi:hypothetical protein